MEVDDTQNSCGGGDMFDSDTEYSSDEENASRPPERRRLNIENDYRYNSLRNFPHIFPTITGFTLEQFDRSLFPAVESVIQPNGSGRGPKKKLCAKSTLIMILYYLRRGLFFFDIASHFGITEASSQRIIKTTIPIIAPIFAQHICWKNWFEQEVHISDTIEPKLWNVVGIVDATEIMRPSGSDAQRPYFSGKKKMHTMKFQIVIQPINGRIMHIFGPKSGAIHDITLFDMSGVSSLLLRREYILGDSGYQGLEARNVRCLVPRKKPRGKERPQQDRIYNSALGRHRVLVENIFARLKNWRIIENKWRGHVSQPEHFSRVFQLCAAFTNMQIALS